jgi:hypothetical protein
VAIGIPEETLSQLPDSIRLLATPLEKKSGKFAFFVTFAKR